MMSASVTERGQPGPAYGRWRPDMESARHRVCQPR